MHIPEQHSPIRWTVPLFLIWWLAVAPNVHAQTDYTSSVSGGDNPLSAIPDPEIGVIQGDFDSDGDVDVLAFDDENYNSFTFYANDGTGSFSAATGSDNPFSSLSASDLFWSADHTYVADFDNDGDVDIWDFEGSSSDDGTSIYLENDNGSYTSSLSGGSNPLSAVPDPTAGVIVGDFDTDGDIDVLAFDDENYNSFSFFANNGSGAFSEVTGSGNPFSSLVADDLFFSSERTYVADFDNDGDVDVWDYGGTSSSSGDDVYLEDVGSSYTSSRAGGDNPLSTVPDVFEAVIQGDFDVDDDVDVLTFDDDNFDSFSFYANNGSGSFSVVTGSDNPFSSLSASDLFWSADNTYVADFDDDRDVDVWDYEGQNNADGTNIYLKKQGAPNTAPTVATNTGSSVNEGSTDSITQSELETTDNEQGPGSLTYTIDTDVTEGQLVNTTGPTQLDQSDTFTQADINNGNIEYQHDGTEPASESFDFTVADGAGGSTSGTFAIMINPVNDAPTITAIANQFVNTYRTLGPLAFTVTDVETANDQLSLSSSSSNTTVVPDANVTFTSPDANGDADVTVDPAEANTGTVQVTVTVDDNSGEANATASETFDVEVVPRALTVSGTAGENSGDAGWRYVGVPTASGLAAGDLRLGGTAPNFTVREGHMLHEWDDTQGTGDPTGGYDPIESSGETLTPGRGYALFLFDEAPYDLDPSLVIDVAGTPTLRGATSVTVSSLAQSARWHLLGNPYPTGYDLSSLTDLSANGFSDNVQRFDGAAGTWDVVSQSSVDLSAWQGFFIERTSTGSGATSVTFDPAGRVASAPFVKALPVAEAPKEASKEAPEQRAVLGLTLQVTGADGTVLSRDRAARVAFDERAQAGWDAYDASKLRPLSAQYALLAPEGTGREGTPVRKAVESRPWPRERQEIPLRLTTEGFGDAAEGYRATIAVGRWEVPEGWRARLVDAESGATHRLGPNATHTFTLPAGAAQEAPRFELQIAPEGAPLPVELAAFDAAETGEGAVRLTWQTASETNNAGFAVQRNVRVGTSRRDVSPQGTGWEQVGFVEGAGTTQDPQSYRFTDAEVPFAADEVAYRLRQVDTDGTAHLSEVITVARRAVTEVRLHGSVPNPARSQTRIRYALPSAQEIRLEVYDLLGRRVRTLVDERQGAGRKAVTFDASRLPSGTYVYRLTAGGRAKTRKLTVVR